MFVKPLGAQQKGSWLFPGVTPRTVFPKELLPGQAQEATNPTHGPPGHVGPEVIWAQEATLTPFLPRACHLGCDPS